MCYFGYTPRCREMIDNYKALIINDGKRLFQNSEVCFLEKGETVIAGVSGGADSMCMLLARGAIINILMVVFLLPPMLVLFDRPICAATSGMRGIYKKEKEKRA